jgi:diguanylate cyclase (GGDEF)-like protein
MQRAVGRTVELTGLHKNGAEFPVELTASTWSIDQERFFTSIVRDISERKRLQAAILTMARTDHLTGLLNRRAVEDTFARELVRSHRYRRELSCMLLDIDHFKRINDTAGHASGDHVLRLMGQLIGGRIRGVDSAARWGGEEFLVILPETSLKGASELAEALRVLVEGTTFSVVPHVTVSIGVAEVGVDESAEQAVARADKNLYAAKSSGRNRVVA